MPQWLRARAAPRLLPSLVWLTLAFGAVTYTLEVFFSLGHLTWVLCAVSFVLNGVSLILHLVHGALKRRLAVDRVIVCVNVASLSAAALMREHLTAKTFWAVSAGVPLVSWYCFWACHAATAMPSAGEALRPAKDLAQCHPVNKLAVVFVLLGEYFQFNSLPFNPDLGFWTDMPSFSALFEASFFVVRDEPHNHTLTASAPACLANVATARARDSSFDDLSRAKPSVRAQAPRSQATEWSALPTSNKAQTTRS